MSLATALGRGKDGGGRWGLPGTGTEAEAAVVGRPAERADHQRADPGAPGRQSLQVRRAAGTGPPRPGRPVRRCPHSCRRLPRRGRHHWVPATQRLFGGQIVGQALVAAAHAVRPEMQVHSLHCYFVRAGE